jgi:hypothetical protein
MTMTVYKNGPRAMVQYTPGVAYLAGDVIVIGGVPFIADTDNPVGVGLAIIQGAVAGFGGIYLATTDAVAYPVGTYMYWNSANSQVTANPVGNSPFGIIVAGPTGLASDGGPTVAAPTCWVLYLPIPYGSDQPKFTTTALAGPQTMIAGLITGANDITLTSTNAAPGTFTTRTAAQMITDGNLSVGQTYKLRIVDIGAGTFTLAAGAGVTLGAGTYTVPTNTFRDFIVTVPSVGAITITTVGVGTYS